jgi:hypothetical protein
MMSIIHQRNLNKKELKLKDGKIIRSINIMICIVVILIYLDNNQL